MNNGQWIWLDESAFPDCIEMIKPDFEEHHTQPSALGLDYIDVAMPSPKGMICAHVEKKAVIEWLNEYRPTASAVRRRAYCA